MIDFEQTVHWEVHKLLVTRHFDHISMVNDGSFYSELLTIS